MIKKLSFVVLFVLFFGFGLSANLSIGPAVGTLGTDCIETFYINLDMVAGERTIASDIIIDSNMEFVGFDNGDIFEYSAPVKQRDGLLKMLLFSSRGNEVYQGGIVGKISFKVPDGVLKPYIKFVFNGEGDTSDTNLSIEGKDILSFVKDGKYTVVDKKNCIHNSDIVVNNSGEDLDMFIARVESDHKIDNIKKFIIEYSTIIISTFIMLFIILIILIFRKRKK